LALAFAFPWSGAVTDPTASDFSAYFEAVHGYAPFEWQMDLADRVVSGRGWPEAVDIPTGMGKTAVIDIAVFALACQAHLPPSERTAPTRTMFIVDRRVIVDQAHQRAMALAQQLREPSSGILADVASALRSITGPNGVPLAVRRMRGGVTWAWRWLPSPDQPAVVVGTVDQMGSRLLFRGYGVGPNLRPIDAALCGTDCLLILDEAHLSHALVETAQAVSRYESRAERPVLPRRRPRPVVMSATLSESATDVHRLDPERETSPTAQARLNAARLLTTVQLSTTARDPVPDLARAMANLVADRISDDQVERAAVVCNTVTLARAVHAQLAADDLGIDLCLLTGRCREFDRNQLALAWGPELASTWVRRPRSSRLVAVATQTIEVGADFDVDLLITEAAPLDSLVQRFGRLNRLGRLPAASAIVIHCDRRHAEDPVYGPTTDKTWAWLRSVTGDVPEARAKDMTNAARLATPADLSPMALAARLDVVTRRTLAAEQPLVPVVLGPTIAAWARTDPSPEPDQAVAPFLHGIARDVAQVQVCWRSGLPEAYDPGAAAIWEAELASVPVAAGETVEVPIWEARRFLSGRRSGHLADVEGVGDGEEIDFEESERVDAWVRRDDSLTRCRADQLRPGDTVIVRAEEGGHDEWGWTGQRGPAVTDVADLCQRTPTLRLRTGVLRNTLGSLPEELSGAIRGAWSKKDESGVAAAVTVALRWVADAHLEPGATSVAASVKDAAARLLTLGVLTNRRAAMKATATVVGEGDEGWFVVSGPRGRDGSFLHDRDGDQEEASSCNATRPVTLDEHLRDVGTHGARVALGMGLPPDLVAAIDLAGRAHDLGKADPRFQVMLHGGDRLRAEASQHALAKSGMDPGDQRAFRAARAASGWPAGMRHECVSAELLGRFLAENPSFAHAVDVELVLHLVSTHHGRARPLFPPLADPDPQPVTVPVPGAGGRTASTTGATLVDWDGPARFERLGLRYGWWGLALLETTVRLADIACSESYGVSEVS
jgi:CRISPR-associated endonuclease/helicase Cas3